MVKSRVVKIEQELGFKCLALEGFVNVRIKDEDIRGEIKLGDRVVIFPVPSTEFMIHEFFFMKITRPGDSSPIFKRSVPIDNFAWHSDRSAYQKVMVKS